MNTLLKRLWREEDGVVLSTEMMLYGTLGVIGAGTGYTALRDSVNSELSDLAKAIGSIDQSYYFAPVVGHSAWTAGSAFYDRADVCDGPQRVVLPQGRPLVCADVFGPQSGAPIQDKYVLPPVTSRPRPDSLPGPGVTNVPVLRPEGGGVNPPNFGPPNFGPPHHHHPHHGAPKGVVIGDVAPAVVLGAPGLVPTAHGNGVPVNVYVNPWQVGPYGFDVPEGYFNRGPGYYRFMVEDHIGHRDYGYNYAHTGKGAETIDLGFAKVGDDELKNLDGFKTAKCLHVLGSNVTDKGLGYIAELQQLESLHLVGTQATDAGLKEVAKIKGLRFLHLIGTKITDKGLANLAGMKKLEVLDVRGTPVTDDGLAKLRKELPALRIVR